MGAKKNIKAQLHYIFLISDNIGSLEEEEEEDYSRFHKMINQCMIYYSRFHKMTHQCMILSLNPMYDR